MGYKIKIKGVIGDLKLKNVFFNLKLIIINIYLGLSVELLWTVWGQFIFR